jgi:hypothetical protein
VRSSPCRAANRPDQAIGNCGRGRASVLHVGRSKTVRAPLAQLAEQLTLNQRVRGSSPWRRTESPGQWPGLFLVFSGIRTFPNTSFADPSSPNESSSAPSNRLATEVDVLGRQRSSAAEHVLDESSTAADLVEDRRRRPAQDLRGHPRGLLAAARVRRSRGVLFGRAGRRGRTGRPDLVDLRSQPQHVGRSGGSGGVRSPLRPWSACESGHFL